jgi:tetratricopeptide (TPR) repeat protein
MKQDARTTAAGRKKSPATAAETPAVNANAAVFHAYMAAVQLLQQGKYDKALAAFEKILPQAPPEILERCRMYMTTCQRQMERPQLAFTTPEEHYDYAVSLLNTGYYEEAREHFETILGTNPQADYAYYGMAILDAFTGQNKECITHLSRAIELNPRNRLQARVDNDFQNIVDDPSFTELLYPEVPLGLN